MKFYIENFGCKVNAYEANYISESLQNNGFISVSQIDDSDIIIVNTCTVTNTADKKCEKFVRRVRRENKDSILIVIGCGVQNNFSKYQEMNIDILMGNKNKSKIVTILNDFLKTRTKYNEHSNNRELEFEDMKIHSFNQTRAYIKIQDGCDNFCSYCIIPFMRGKCRSKNFDTIIDEAKILVNMGHKEIVLTGIHTGSYNYNGLDLVDVINELSKIEGLLRIRLSSVEITELNDKFLNMLKNNSKFCSHLHIPIQSGSNRVLKMMNRKYDIEYFLKKIESIRSIRKDISLTTDLIVGFPEETDEDFKESYENLERLKFSKIHVFPYSKRDGTVASRMKDIDSKIKKDRTKAFLELSEKLEKEYSDLFIGQEVEVLIEEYKNNYSIGHTSNYLLVKTQEKLEKNQIAKVVYKNQ